MLSRRCGGHEAASQRARELATQVIRQSKTGLVKVWLFHVHAFGARWRRSRWQQILAPDELLVKLWVTARPRPPPVVGLPVMTCGANNRHYYRFRCP
jgi:hypothetical protein